MQITKENTVAEVVSKNLGSDHVFSKYNIDFCCGGGDTLEKACRENGVDFEVLKQEIETINNKISRGTSVEELDIPTLISEVKGGFHTTISDMFFEILPYANKVSKVHGESHKEVIEINDLVNGVEVVISETFRNSIMSLYPIINEIVEASEKQEEVTIDTLQNLQKAIKRNEIAQGLMGDAFKEISKLSSNYTTPEGACNSYKYLYANLKQLEHQVHKYMHFEKNVLIPKALNIIE
ncbi:regulator of cell morphogenesis and NO signaling [Lutibacter oricola]|uniref:Regulator of cell morphogenesis and NO signaling n=1 Tax=Lutibacter oricola TaxID=762486 RepID=A0A1H3B7W3_9FLAO|nr:DUF542 domain-containing protein [Lutibacter oricola]SDX37731.1 regulator of cell morphogenesis and NO signaling [Lutibacter oricola]